MRKKTEDLTMSKAQMNHMRSDLETPVGYIVGPHPQKLTPSILRVPLSGVAVPPGSSLIATGPQMSWCAARCERQ